MRFVFVTILVACVASGAWAEEVQEKAKPCNIAVRCSSVENLVWATDGSRCYVFRNGCFLTSANCKRRNENKKELKKVTKQRCQTMCGDVCPEVYRPVCASYKEARRTFGNSCRLNSYICRSGELYELESNGACEPTTNENSA